MVRSSFACCFPNPLIFCFVYCHHIVFILVHFFRIHFSVRSYVCFCLTHHWVCSMFFTILVCCLQSCHLWALVPSLHGRLKVEQTSLQVKRYLSCINIIENISICYLCRLLGISSSLIHGDMGRDKFHTFGSPIVSSDENGKDTNFRGCSIWCLIYIRKKCKVFVCITSIPWFIWYFFYLFYLLKGWCW